MGEKTKVAVQTVIRRRSGKKAKRIEFLIEKYKELHPDVSPDAIRPDMIADWAVEQGMWMKPAPTPAELLRREISTHLKESYFQDPQGREVRSMHAVFVDVMTPTGVKRRSEWFRLFAGRPEQILLSAQLRRNAALADVGQLELDLASYDDNNIHGAKLPPRSYNFDKDLDEKSQPASYPASAPDDDEDDEI